MISLTVFLASKVRQLAILALAPLFALSFYYCSTEFSSSAITNNFELACGLSVKAAGSVVAKPSPV